MRYLVPTFRTLLCLLILTGASSQSLWSQGDPDDAFWDSRFGPPGVDGPVFASAAAGDLLFLGGRFTSTAQLPSRNIVLWNRATFQFDSLGSGIDGEVRALLVVGNDLYVGGNFRRAGGQPANFLARWDIVNKQWHPVGTATTNGTDTTVWELVEHHGEVYIGGEFHRAGGVRAVNLAVYTPSTAAWRGEFDTVYAPNYGREPTVITAIAFDGEDLYIGGQFEYVDQLPGGRPFAQWVHASCVAQRVNGQWSDLSDDDWPSGPPVLHGVSGKVWDIIPLGDRILMCGEFRTSDHDGRYYDSVKEVTTGEDDRPQSLSCPGFTTWEKNERYWIKTPVHGGRNLRLPAFVYDMTLYHGRVFLAGMIRGSGADNTIGVAEWSTTQNVFFPLAPGSLGGNAVGWTLSVVGPPGDDELLIAGDFSRTGDVPTTNATLFNGSSYRPLSSLPDNGTDNTVFASTLWNSQLLVAGSFSRAGGTTTGPLARWNGNAWAPLDDGTHLRGSLRALLVRGSELFVGGRFSLDGTPTSIARWDGSQWHTLADGLNDTVFALAALGNDLVAAGSFTRSGATTVNRIARWNGTAWSTLGLNGADATVYALATTGSGASTVLYAGGAFSTIGGVQANHLAEFDGNAWRALGSGSTNGTSGTVFALAANASSLSIGGDFQNAGGVRAPYLALWNRPARAWQQIGLPSSTGLCSPVRALLLQGSTLTVGGDFIALDQLTPGYLAQWDGTRWRLLGPAGGNGTSAPVYTLTADGSSALWAGGSFLATANGLANRIAHWDGARWSALGAVPTGGLNAPVYALALSPEELFAGGSFTLAGTALTPNIARFSRANGSWLPLADGTNGPVYALLWHQQKLYVGGDFDHLGTLRINNLAVWDPATEQWSPVGDPAANGTNGPVYALAAEGNQLFVGGSFQSGPNASAARNLLGWNLATGTPIALGGADSTVRALAISGRHLFVGGDFQTVNSEQAPLRANSIARYRLSDGVWQRLGAGMSDPVLALAALEEDVYVGGPFLVAGTIQPERVARWDNAVEFWDYLGEGVPGTVRTSVGALAMRGREVYVGGNFRRAGQTSAGLVARWDTLERVWRSMGSGLEGGEGGEVLAMAADAEELWVGGNFTEAGQKGSLFLARWSKPAPSRTAAGLDDHVTGATPSTLAGRPAPNPFSEGVTLPLHLTQASQVEAIVLDATGREIDQLVISTRMERGEYQLHWQPQSSTEAGLYLLRLRVDSQVLTFPITFVR